MEQFIFGPIQTEWLKSLKEHPERQLKGSLGKKYPDGTYKACCLGEAGLIAGVCEWREVGDQVILYVKESSQLSVLVDVYETIGLFNSEGRRTSGYPEMSLAIMNDSGKTWPEIAAIIEADPWAYLKEPK